MNPGNFLVQFWAVLKTFHMNMFAAVFSMLGIVLLFPDRKKLFFLYVFFIVNFFGLWIFITLNFALIERFLLPFHVYLVIFGAVFLYYVLGKLRDVSLRMGLVKFVLTGVCLIFFLTNLHFQAHSLNKRNSFLSFQF